MNDDPPNVDQDLDREIESLVKQMGNMLREDTSRFKSASKPDKNRLAHPDWVSQTRAVEGVENYMREKFGDDNSRPLVYYLPPLHLFFAGAPSSDITVQKVHNWLRIRSWCFDQIRQHDEILMTAAQWRYALEGKYYAVPYEHLKVKGGLGFTLEDYDRLPLPPQDMKRRVLDPEAKHRKNNESTQHKRVAGRIQINIRFGVHGGFPPYSPDDKVVWGGEDWDAARLAKCGTRVIRGVVWELSVANFRLELLQLDRTLLDVVYKHPDRFYAARRERMICSIWKNGWARPAWEDDPESDPLNSASWKVRVPPVQRLWTVISLWPGSDNIPTWSESFAHGEEEFRKFEYQLFLFYAQEFYRLNGRRPVLPLLQPEGMDTQRSV